ncbi:hypothetical protein D3C75_572090 [compost metagenome]
MRSDLVGVRTDTSREVFCHVVADLLIFKIIYFTSCSIRIINIPEANLWSLDLIRSTIPFIADNHICKVFIECYISPIAIVTVYDNPLHFVRMDIVLTVS